MQMVLLGGSGLPNIWDGKQSRARIMLRVEFRKGCLRNPSGWMGADLYGVIIPLVMHGSIRFRYIFSLLCRSMWSPHRTLLFGDIFVGGPSLLVDTYL